MCRQYNYPQAIVNKDFFTPSPTSHRTYKLFNGIPAQQSHQNFINPYISYCITINYASLISYKCNTSNIKPNLITHIPVETT